MLTKELAKSALRLLASEIDYEGHNGCLQSKVSTGNTEPHEGSPCG